MEWKHCVYRNISIVLIKSILYTYCGKNKKEIMQA